MNPGACVRFASVSVVATTTASCSLVLDSGGYDVSVDDSPTDAGSQAGRLEIASALLGGGACSQCLSARCRDEVVACAGSDACVAYAACAPACTDPVCRAACSRGTEPTQSATAELVACATHCDPDGGGGCVAECQEACSLGRHFECAGAYEVGTVTTPEQLDVTYRFYDFGDGAASGDFDGRPVWMCGIDDERCGDSTPKLTGENGVVTMRVHHRSTVDGQWKPMPHAVQMGEPGTWPSGRFIFSVPLVPPPGTILTLLAVPLEPGTQSAYVNGKALDCWPSQQWGARGVVVEIDPPMAIEYGIGTGPVILMSGNATDLTGAFFSTTPIPEGFIDAVVRYDDRELVRFRPFAKGGYWNTIVAVPAAVDAP